MIRVREHKKDEEVKDASSLKNRIAPESDVNDDKIYFMALGGLEHVGQNMYVYKYRGKY